MEPTSTEMNEIQLELLSGQFLRDDECCFGYEELERAPSENGHWYDIYCHRGHIRWIVIVIRHRANAIIFFYIN